MVKYLLNKEGMKPQDVQNNKILLCYYGGSFREGTQFSTTQDTKNGYDNQYYASQSHIKLNKILNKKGYEITTIIHTYHSKYEDEINKWYNPFEYVLHKLNKNIKSTDGRDNIINSVIKNIKNINQNDYDFILFIRIDLFLKPDFYKILNLETEKINFLAHNFHEKHCGFTESKDPVVVDLMLLVPKKYYHILDNNFKLNHESWTYYKMKYKLSNEDMTFMSDLMFDSNSYLDYNPYYIISGRPENKIFHNTNKTDPTVYGKVVKDCKIHPKIKSEYLHNPAEYYFMNNKNYYE